MRYIDGIPVIEETRDLTACRPANASYSTGYIATQSRQGEVFGSLFWNVKKIDRAEWPERIKDQKAKKTSVEAWLRAAGYRAQNQKSFGYCWMYGTQGAAMARGCMDDGKWIHRNPFYPAYLGKNGRNEGGLAEEAFRYIGRFGVPEWGVFPDQPTNRSAYERQEVKVSAEAGKVASFYELPRNDFEAAVSVLLADNPLPVTLGLNWWGHLVFASWVEQLGRDEFGLGGWNSWGEDWGDKGRFILAQPKATAFEQYAVDLVTIAA